MRRSYYFDQPDIASNLQSGFGDRNRGHYPVCGYISADKTCPESDPASFNIPMSIHSDRDMDAGCESMVF